jgi:hypothetical protein
MFGIDKNYETEALTRFEHMILCEQVSITDNLQKTIVLSTNNEYLMWREKMKKIRIFIIIGIILSLVIISLYAISFFIIRDLFPLFFWIYPILFAFALLSIALACLYMTK